MLTQNEINALLEERRGYVVRGLKDRVAQVDEQLRSRGGISVEEAPAVETAEAPQVEVAAESVGKRGPGRPRKPTA